MKEINISQDFFLWKWVCSLRPSPRRLQLRPDAHEIPIACNIMTAPEQSLCADPVGTFLQMKCSSFSFYTAGSFYRVCGKAVISYDRPVSAETFRDNCRTGQESIIYIYISSSSVICQTTGPNPLPKRFLHIVRSWVSSFNWQYPLLSVTLWRRNYFFNFSTPSI